MTLLTKTILILTPFVFVACNSSDKTADIDSTSSTEQTSAKAYPLDTCLVSGEKLGSMGDPVVIVHEGQEIKFCCDKCQPRFKKDPAKYLTKLDGSTGDSMTDH